MVVDAQVEELGAVHELAGEAQVLGGPGFTGLVTKPESVTLIAGIVKDKRVYHVHTAAPPKNAEEAKRVHEAFLKGLKLARQS